MLRSWMAWCGLAAFVSMPAARSWPPLADLTGIVYSESTNQRVRHASVWLCDGGGNRLQESVTSDSGEFAFLSVHAGSFVLKVVAPGYQPAEIPVEVNFGAERGVSVFLKAAKTSAAGAAAGSTISAHEARMAQSARDLVDSGRKKLYADKNPQKALRDFESAVAKAPGYYEAYYLLAMTYIALGDPVRGEVNLQKSVDQIGRASCRERV